MLIWLLLVQLPVGLVIYGKTGIRSSGWSGVFSTPSSSSTSSARV